MKHPSIREMLLLLSVLMTTHVLGAPDDMEQAALHLQAEVLRNSAKTQRAAAETRYAAEERVCLDKFLVSSCLEDAKKARQQALRAAKITEQEARSIDRRIKANEREMKAARRQETAAQREAETASRAAKSQRDYAEALQRVERKQAESAPRRQE